MPDIVTAVPEVLTWADALSRSHSLSLSVSVSLCDSLGWHPAELGSRERESERESADTAGYRKRRKYWHIREIDTAWLTTYFPLSRSPAPFPCSIHNSPFPTLDSTAANVNVRGCCSFCFRFWGNFVPLCVVKCLNWAARAWRHHIKQQQQQPDKKFKYQMKKLQR